MQFAFSILKYFFKEKREREKKRSDMTAMKYKIVKI